MARAQEVGVAAAQRSCRNFVESFYAWYVPRVWKGLDTPPFSAALKDRSSAFSSELFRWLLEEVEAERKGAGGLESDPFLNRRSLPERAIVGAVSATAENCRAEVYGDAAAMKSGKPDLVPEMKFEYGHWFFMDFVYPGKEKLLPMLERLREGRKQGR